MSFTHVVTRTNKTSQVKIKPYFDRSVSNMGLEDYGITLFDGVKHMEQLACIERNGIVRYVTGLNEFSPEVKNLTGDDKQAKITQIRKTVAELERELASNIIDHDDKDFWNKVTLLKPNNTEFWNKIELKCGNEPVFLDLTDPYDRIKYHAIEAGGFSLVAKSYDDARSQAVPPKFYLDREEDTAMIRTEYKKLRNKAYSELQKLFDKNSKKLFYIAKVVDTHSTLYKKDTPNDIIYENMDTYISGDGIEPNKERAANSFLDAVNSDMESLKIRAIVKDSVFFKYIINKSDGFIYHNDTNAALGRNVTDVVEYLKNPLHDDILNDLVEKCEAFWNS
jgi:hypothetical protein